MRYRCNPRVEVSNVEGCILFVDKGSRFCRVAESVPALYQEIVLGPHQRVEVRCEGGEDFAIEDEFPAFRELDVERGSAGFEQCDTGIEQGALVGVQRCARVKGRCWSVVARSRICWSVNARRRDWRRFDDFVVAWTRVDGIDGWVTDEGVVSSLTEDDVGARLAVYFVISVASEQDIVSSPAVDDVLGVAALDVVVARPSVDYIISRVSTDRVVTCAAVDGVGAERSDDHIVAVGAGCHDT